METKEYFEKVMQDFNQNRRGRNLRKPVDITRSSRFYSSAAGFGPRVRCTAG